MEGLERFLILFFTSAVIGILTLIQKSSSENEDKATNVKTTSGVGIGFLFISIIVLIIYRIKNIKDVQSLSGVSIPFMQQSVMFLSSFVLVFCAAFLGIVSVYGKYLQHNQYFWIVIVLLVLSILLAGWFSTRQTTFDGTGQFLLVLIGGLVIAAGVLIQTKISLEDDPDIGSELKKSFDDLYKVAYAVGGFPIVCWFLYYIRKAFAGESTTKPTSSPLQTTSSSSHGL